MPDVLVGLLQRSGREFPGPGANQGINRIEILEFDHFLDRLARLGGLSLHAQIDGLDGGPHKSLGSRLQSSDRSDQFRHPQPVGEIVPLVVASAFGQIHGLLKDPADRLLEFPRPLLAPELGFLVAVGVDHLVGDDFDLEGVDIELVHVLGEREVVLLDGGKLHGGVLDQDQRDGQGAGKKDEQGDDARHDFGPETRAHPGIVA